MLCGDVLGSAGLHVCFDLGIDELGELSISERRERCRVVCRVTRLVAGEFLG